MIVFLDTGAFFEINEADVRFDLIVVWFLLVSTLVSLLVLGSLLFLPAHKLVSGQLGG